MPRSNAPAAPASAGRPEAGGFNVERFRLHAILALLAVVFIVIPALNLLGVVEPHHLNRIGRYLCFAIAALGIDLIWGYAGVLTLCHALFFCLGGYAMAMHLSLPAGGGDVRPEYNNIPQFFFFNGVETLPFWWEPFASLPFALVAALAVPALVAGALGFFIFRNRVRGVYFAIITQALAWGAFLAFSRNEMLLGGTNGLTNFYKPLNSENGWILGLYLLASLALAGTFLACRYLTRSRLGRVLVAIRDNETRLYFLGYRPDLYKTFAFAAAAGLAALGGLLYVPQNGIVTPNVMRVEDSIWMVIWVAVGGRGRLWGAVTGALLASFTYSALTTDLPRAWPFIQAGLFLGVLAFPGGIADLWSKLEADLGAGGRIGRMLAVLIFFEGALILDKLGLFPAALTRNGLAGVPLKYWIIIGLAAAIAAIGRKRVAPAAIPLLGVGWFVLTEALGLMPTSFALLKYGLVLATIAAYLYLEGALSFSPRAAWGWRRRDRRAAQPVETPSAGSAGDAS